MMRSAVTALLLIAASACAADEAAHGTARRLEAVDLVQWSLSLVAVVVAIVGLAWLLRRIGRFSAVHGGRFRVLAALPVGPRERVVLVQAGDKQLILGVAPGQVRALCVLEGSALIGAADDAAVPPAEESFGARINQLLARGPQ